MHSRTLICLVTSVALFACGDDEESKPTTVEDPATTQQGKAVGDSSTSLTVIPAGADESAGQVAFNQVGSSIQAFVGQYQAFKAQQAQGNAQGASGLPGQLRQAQEAEGAGEFSFTDGQLQANVNYESPQGSISYVVDLAITDVDGGKSIDGTFDLNYKGSNGGYDIDYSYDATYDAVTITAGCAASGSISINYKIKLSGEMIDNLPPAARAQVEAGVGGSGTITATFGPTCADVVVAGT